MHNGSPPHRLRKHSDPVVWPARVGTNSDCNSCPPSGSSLRRRKESPEGSFVNSDLHRTDQKDDRPVRAFSEHSSFGILLLVFLGCLLVLIGVYLSFPKMTEDEKQHMKIPLNLNDAQDLGVVLSKYTDKHFIKVISGFYILFLFLQTFAIPGTLFLTILGGYLFSFWISAFLCCFCTATGASFCYCLCAFFGRDLVYRKWPDKISQMRNRVEEYHGELLLFVIAARLSPVIPNWSINIMSPLIGVPLKPFWIGTFIGVFPAIMVYLNAGISLHSLTSASDIMSWRTFLSLFVIGLCAFVAPFIADWLRGFASTRSRHNQPTNQPTS